jgi:thioredoxin 1
VERLVGARPERAYKSAFDTLLSKPGSDNREKSDKGGSMAKPITVTDADFEEKVMNANVPVAVDFWAPWCAPCRVVGPVLDKLSGEYEGRMVVAKVNTDEEVNWATRLGIQGIPTVIMFKDGKEVDRLVGSRPESAYKSAFDKLLA